MRGLALNLLMALVWALFGGDFSTRAFVVGYLVGFLVLWLFPESLGTRGYVQRSFAILRFVGYFLSQLSLANIQVALFAVSPNPKLYPMIVAVPLRAQGLSIQTLLSVVITLMPGTVAMGFSADRRTLYAHSIGLAEPQEVRHSIQQVEDRLMLFWQHDEMPRTAEQSAKPLDSQHGGQQDTQQGQQEGEVS